MVLKAGLPAGRPPPGRPRGRLRAASGPSGLRSQLLMEPTIKYWDYVIEDASARPPHPQIVVTADGVAQSVLGVYA